MKLSWDYAFQLFVNGIASGSGYAMLAVGFGMILHVTGRFHVAYGAIYAATAFMAAQLTKSLQMPFVAALLLGVIGGVILAVGMELAIYSPLGKRAGASKLFIIFVASLGMNTAGQSVLSLIWPSAIAMSRITLTEQKVGPAVTTNVQLYSTIVAWVAIGAVALLIQKTTLGRMVRAVRVNPGLSLDMGIDPRYIYVIVFSIGTALGGINAVFVAAQSAPAANLGQTTILYAVAAAFVAGPSASVVTIGALGLLIGLIESMSGLFVSQGWESVVVFGAIFVYVLIRASLTVNWWKSPNRVRTRVVATES